MNHYPAHLETILDNCVTAVREQGRSVNTCLELHPEHGDVLEPLLQLTQRLQAAQTLRPRPEFRQVAAQRMHNLIAARPRPDNPRQTAFPTPPTHRPARQWLAQWWRRQMQSRPIAVMLSLIFIIGLMLSSVTVHAANETVPGQTLYPVKLVVENTRLALSFDAVEQAQLRLSFAARRLEETAVLLAKGSTSHIQPTLNAYQAEIETVRAALEENSTLTAAQKQTLAQWLIAELDQYEVQLTELIGQTPVNAHAWLQSALETSQLARDHALTIITGESDEAITAPTATPTPPAPTATASPPPATATLTPTPTSTPTPVRATAVPPTSIPSPQEALPPTISAVCLSPPTYLEPEAWSAWLERCASAVDLPPHWLEDLPPNWPAPSPFPTPPAPDVWQTPLPWPAECGTPPDNLDPQAWQEWLEQCNIPTAEWPSDWPSDWPELPPTEEWATSPDQLPPPPEDWKPPDDLPPPPDNWPDNWGG